MDKQRVTEAVNQLIYAPNYATLVNEMTRIIETWHTHPMVYGGNLRYLNAIVDVGLVNRSAFERIVKLVEERRKLVPHAKRVDYQRELMQVRRAREAKAIELHETLHGPLRGSRRQEYLTGLRDRWRAARAAFIAERGDGISWKERNTVANEFWDMIDRQLDANLYDAKHKRA